MKSIPIFFKLQGLSLSFFCIVLFFLSSYSSFAQTNELISIETKNAILVYRTGPKQKVYQAYFGEKLEHRSDYLKIPLKHEAYTTSGTTNLYEAAIRVQHSDGNPSLHLVYKSHTTNVIDNNRTKTTIVLKDPNYPIEVRLFFESYTAEDIIKTWTTIQHQEAKPIILHKYASNILHVDASQYWLTQFGGDWAKEMNLQESKLTSGIKIIDSKLGTRAHMYANPLFLMSLDTPATENQGNVIVGSLAWSGNFQLAFELDRLNSLRMISGINPYASEYTLLPNEVFTTPEFIFTFSAKGKGKASRSFHDWARNYGIVDGTKPRLTLLNNWEATYFDFNQEKLSTLFDDAKKLDVDMFLLDDGWFGNKYPRNDDTTGLGDWQENKKKLPNGIGYLEKLADKKGVKFGIWLEPEMVSPKSELYEKHPDWVLKLPNREEDYFRYQMVLDLSNPEVQQFIYELVDDLLTKHPNISYIKFDSNRMITNPYSQYLKENQSHLYLKYVEGLYDVLKKLNAKRPHFPMMLCSGGGGRVDYGAMKYFTEFWPSDNTNAYDRIYIQWGFSHFFPANAMACHITSMGNQSLKYRTDVAMMGKLGYDIRINEMTAEELEFSKKAVQNYKRLSSTIWYGDMYRLISPYEEERAALNYVSKDQQKAVVFFYNLHSRRDRTALYSMDKDGHHSPYRYVKMKGLSATTNYKVKEINTFGDQENSVLEHDKTYTGDYLMKIGMRVLSEEPMTSTIIEVTAVK